MQKCSSDKGIKLARDVIGVFNKISGKYDLLDSFISWGQDQRWRRRVVDDLDLKPGLDVLDCGAGTGKLSRLIVQRCPQCKLVALDINKNMFRSDLLPGVEFRVSSAEDLPFPDGTFDRIASAFLTRNVDHLDIYFSEVSRVLKPGGIFVNLDIFPSAVSWFNPLFSFYFYNVVPVFGNMVTKSQSYTYLAGSVKNFITPEKMNDLLLKSGFSVRPVRKFMYGTVAINNAAKV